MSRSAYAKRPSALSTFHSALSLQPVRVGAPVLHALLDLAAALVLAGEHGTNGVDDFGVAAEAQSDQIARRQLSDARAQIIRQACRETHALFEPDDPILVAETVVTRQEAARQ